MARRPATTSYLVTVGLPSEHGERGVRPGRDDDYDRKRNETGDVDHAG